MKLIKYTLLVIAMFAACFLLACWKEKDEQATLMAATKAETQEIETALTIMLDPGHGGYDSGAVAENGVMEKDVTLSLTLLIGQRLEEAGFYVVYTRVSDIVSWESDNLDDLSTRVQMASQFDADYYLSIHTNFSAYGDGAYGFESYMDGSNESILSMANNIHQSLNALAYSVDRGQKSTKDTPLYVIDQNEVPAMLLEIGFLSNANEAQYLVEEQVSLASAIADGIEKTLLK